MNEQLKYTDDGQIKGEHEHKVELAIQRLQTFEPPEGYYLCFSGGKDSQCIYHLAKMAGVKFDAHYSVTSVDPPELIRHIKKYYPDVIWERQYWDDGKPEHYFRDGRPKSITMWNLIAAHTLPPTRKARYCCDKLKEPGGQGRLVVTGVRWAESVNRRKTHGVVGLQGKPKTTIKLADEMGADYKLNKYGEVIMNNDNDVNRRMVEHCYRTQKTMLNPIVDWTDDDVWMFLNENNIPHCELYDLGFSRLGCIGCPLSGTKNMLRNFERWPKYKELYIRAFEKMIENHPGQIKILDPNADTKFKLDCFEDNLGDMALEPSEPLTKAPMLMARDKMTGAELAEREREREREYATSILQEQPRSNAVVSVRMDDGTLNSSSDSSQQTVTDSRVCKEQSRAEQSRAEQSRAEQSRARGLLQKRCSGDGSGSRCAEFVFEHWVELGAT